MRHSGNTDCPAARRDGLVVRTVDGETLVFDKERNVAHCLNETAAAVWAVCDGATSVAEMSFRLSSERGVTMSEQSILDALVQLERDHLLVSTGALAGAITRNHMLRKVGIATVAAVAVPSITSIVAPEAFVHASRGRQGPSVGAPTDGNSGVTSGQTQPGAPSRPGWQTKP